MRRLHEVHVEVVVGEYGAADWGNGDGMGGQIQFSQYFGQKPVNDAVAATRAIVSGAVGQNVRLAVDETAIRVCRVGTGLGR